MRKNDVDHFRKKIEDLLLDLELGVDIDSIPEELCDIAGDIRKLIKKEEE